MIADSKLIGLEYGLIRKLSGFQKNHFIPENLSPAGHEFIRKIGAEDVKHRAETLFSLVRKQYQFKRREIEYSCEGGSATLRTAHFEIDLDISQASENLRQYQMRTSISLTPSEVTPVDDTFTLCFSHYVDQLVVNFPQMIDIEEAIDRIEELPEAAKALDYAPDGSNFSLDFKEQDLLIQVTASEITFRLQRSRNLQALLERSQEALDVLAPARLDPRLQEF
ncbi:MAG: hypothetical protein AAF546_02105 [Verrucomicrobiota bacterium]